VFLAARLSRGGVFFWTFLDFLFSFFLRVQFASFPRSGYVFQAIRFYASSAPSFWSSRAPRFSFLSLQLSLCVLLFADGIGPFSYLYDFLPAFPPKRARSDVRGPFGYLRILPAFCCCLPPSFLHPVFRVKLDFRPPRSG